MFRVTKMYSGDSEGIKLQQQKIIKLDPDALNVSNKSKLLKQIKMTQWIQLTQRDTKWFMITPTCSKLIFYFTSFYFFSSSNTIGPIFIFLKRNLY